MSACSTQTAGGVSHGSSMAIKPPSHPTYDLKAVIKLALAEDAGDTGSLSSLLSKYQKFRFLFVFREIELVKLI